MLNLDNKKLFLSLLAPFGIYKLYKKYWHGMLYIPLFLNSVLFMMGWTIELRLIGYILLFIWVIKFSEDIYDIYKNPREKVSRINRYIVIFLGIPCSLALILMLAFGLLLLSYYLFPELRYMLGE